MWGDKAHQSEFLLVCMTASAWQIVLLLMSQSNKKQDKAEEKNSYWAKAFLSNLAEGRHLKAQAFSSGNSM